MTKEEYKNILQITEQKYLELGASRKHHGTDNYENRTVVRLYF